jgi:hypothetical protein
MIVRYPSGEETTRQSNPVRWARRGLEKSTVNSHPRKLPLPDTRGPSQAARKPQQTPPSASSIEIDVSQEDFAAMTNLARTAAGTVQRTLEASGHVKVSYRRVRILASDALRAMLEG